MGKYKHDMTKETDPSVQMPVGWHEYVVAGCREATSKAGNDMFIITLVLHKDSSISGDVYAIAEQGKRWFLKQLLTACQVAAGKDGVYEWDTDDVIGKHVLAQGISRDEKWIDREGNERVTARTKIAGFKAIGEEVQF